MIVVGLKSMALASVLMMFSSVSFYVCGSLIRAAKVAVFSYLRRAVITCSSI